MSIKILSLLILGLALVVIYDGHVLFGELTITLSNSFVASGVVILLKCPNKSYAVPSFIRNVTVSIFVDVSLHLKICSRRHLVSSSILCQSIIFRCPW